MAIVKVENITKNFGKFRALDKVNLEINEGEILRVYWTKWSGENHYN